MVNQDVSSEFRQSSGVITHVGIGPATGGLHRSAVPAPVTEILDTVGWTQFTFDSTVGKVVYVDSVTGSDSNNGLWPDQIPASMNGPKRTLNGDNTTTNQGAIRTLTTGNADWLLLKHGSVWDTSVEPNPSLTERDAQNNYAWRKSGHSISQPMLIGSYGGGPGDARPKIKPSVTLPINGGGTGTHGWSANSALSHIAIIDIDFEMDYVDNHNNGPFNVQGGHITNLLLEGCRFANGCNNITLSTIGGTRSQNVIIRRNVIVDAYRKNTDGVDAVGFYMAGIEGLLIEENIVDRNGLQYPEHPNVHGYQYGHAFYIQGGQDSDPNGQNYKVGCTNVTVRGNIVARGDGIGIRNSGVVSNNLVLRSPLGMTFGTDNNSPQQDTTGFTVTVFGNVFLGGDDLYPGGPSPWVYDAGYIRGFAMILSNVVAGTVSYNIIANNAEASSTRLDGTSGGGNQPVGMYCQAQDAGGTHRGVTNAEIHHNIIYKWGGGYATWTAGSPPYQSVAMGFKTDDGNNLGAKSLDTVNFHDNDIQYPGTDEGARVLGLFHHDDSVANSRAGLSGANNRFWAETGPNATATPIGVNNWNQIASSPFNLSMPNYVTTTVGGVSVPALTGSGFGSAVTYSAPTRSVGGFHAAIGGQHGGITADGTLNTFLADARLQRRGVWKPLMMPTYGVADIAGGTLYSAYPAGTTSLGPLRYIRDGFDVTAMGVAVTSVSANTGAPGTTVVITGTGFQSGSSTTTGGTNGVPLKVFFGTAQADGAFVVIQDATHIQVKTPAHASGSVTITVDTGNGYATSSTPIYAYP